ncbi:MAG: pyridoxine 5'-phosphate synthase [Akkermansiaceae bacterium]|nr:pyridoxine 5'-phosphate synthase [Akkermansiaceae bacterium]NNM29907.1 pyridoxine 5'-phosphate synthase [Akkermansiaceae bacterium]
MSLLLGVNIDHVATLRQARYVTMPESPNAEPCPLQAALEARDGGADSITLHVRGDRRHIQEADAFVIREGVRLPLNLEMANTAPMVALAMRLRPEYVCLVPENRQEVTTEGGLDAAGQIDSLGPTIETLAAAGMKVSLFIDPDAEQVAAAATLGAPIVELHTGCFANAVGEAHRAELDRLVAAARLGQEHGLQVNAGHGINYQNITQLFYVPGLTEFNIGHTIVSRALAVGMTAAVREMKELMKRYPPKEA